MIIALEGVWAAYSGGPDILRNLSLRIIPGKFYCIIGPNGAGKSTLLRVMSGFLRPRRGRVLFQSEDVTGIPPYELLTRGIALVPQGHSLFPEMSVYENLLMGAYTVRDERLVRKRLEEVYALFPVLRERARSRALELSGGMQKMVEIARALLVDPQVILLDEPSLGLAPSVQQEVFDVARRLTDAGRTVVMVEQNARQGLERADIGVVLDLGTVVLEAPARTLLDDPRVRQWYLGQSVGTPARG